MPTIEEMTKILKDEGYSFVYRDYGGRRDTLVIGYGCDEYDFEMECLGDDDTVKQAYAHYLQQERFAKMEALLRETIEWFDKPLEIRDIDMLNGVMAFQFAKTVGEAKAILPDKEIS